MTGANHVERILALWAVPRSTSTAFEWMMRQRGDLGFPEQPQARPEVDLADAALRVREAYAIVEPHYRRLYEHRIVIE